MNQRIVFAGTPGSRIIMILYLVEASWIGFQVSRKLVFRSPSWLVDEERLVGYEVDRVIGGGRCTQADERRRRR